MFPKNAKGLKGYYNDTAAKSPANRECSTSAGYVSYLLISRPRSGPGPSLLL